MANVTLIAIANGILGIAQLVIMVLLAHLSTPTVVGYYALAASTVTPVFFFANLGLRHLYISEKHLTPHRTRLYISARFAMVLLAMGLLLIYVPLAPENPFTPFLLPLIALPRAIDALAELTTAIQHKQHRFTLASTLIVVRASLSLLAFSGALILTSLTTAFLVYAAVNIILFSTLDYPLMRTTAAITASPFLSLTRTTIDDALALLWKSAPLGATMAVTSILQFVPRAVLSSAADMAVVAHYASINQLVQVAVILTSSIGQFVAPRLAHAHHENDNHRFSTVLVLAALPILLGSILFIPLAIPYGPTLLTLIYGPAFIFPPIAIATMLIGGIFSCLSILLSFALSASHIFRPQFYIGLAQLALTATLTPWLIHNTATPLQGAALAFVIQSAFACLLTTGLLAIYRRHTL